MNINENINMKSLKICEVLKCDVEGVIEYGTKDNYIFKMKIGG